jgi:uncharacterized membrane protein
MSSPLDTKPSHESLRIIRNAGLISSEVFWRGIRELNEPGGWAKWAARLCLLLGSALVMAGIVYFFAFNWDALDRWQKLGLLQMATLGALIGGQSIGFGRLGGKLLLLCSAICVGVSFAVFGQVYQTGADAFGFFGMWAIAILPWVLAGAFAPLWVLWWVLINLTTWFFWHQVGQYHETIHYSYVCLALSLLNASGLALREGLQSRLRWLSNHWLRHLLLLGAAIPLLVPALELVIDGPRDELYSLIIATSIWLVGLAAAFLYFTRRQYDSSSLSILLSCAAFYLLAAMARLLEEADLYDSGAGFLAMALIIGGITAMVVRLLRWLGQRYNPNGGNQP